MKTNTKILIVLIVLALLDTLIPVPLTAVLLIYVLVNRPAWFQAYVSELYGAAGDGRGP